MTIRRLRPGEIEWFKTHGWWLDAQAPGDRREETAGCRSLAGARGPYSAYAPEPPPTSGGAGSIGGISWGSPVRLAGSGSA